MTPLPALLERLIHVLLEDELRRRPSTDLTDRVLSRAFPVRQKRRANGFGIPGAIAASVTVAVAAWLLFSSRYPNATLEGNYVLEDGKLQRGAVVRTADRTASLRLGGYCAVTLSPETRVRLDGRERAEQVALLQGEVRCKVDRSIGTFDVLTPAGTVSVKGTEFQVSLNPKPPRAGVDTAKVPDFELVVTVLSGQVNVHHGGEEHLVSAGSTRTFGQESRLPEVKISSEDPPSERQAVDTGEQNALARGTVVGVITAKGQAWIEVTSISGKTERYVPVWQRKAPDPIGGPNKQTLAKMSALPLGTRVRLRWFVDNSLRISDIEVDPVAGKAGNVK